MKESSACGGTKGAKRKDIRCTAERDAAPDHTFIPGFGENGLRICVCDVHRARFFKDNKPICWGYSSPVNQGGA